MTENSDLNGDSPQFTITCVSMGGPVIGCVVWRINKNVIPNPNATSVLLDRVNGMYVHNLTVSEVVGECKFVVRMSVIRAMSVIRGSTVYQYNPHTLSMYNTLSFSLSPLGWAGLDVSAVWVLRQTHLVGLQLEPITYFVGYGTSILIFSYFVLTRQV